MHLPIDLVFIEAKHGKLLLNPIGNHIFIPNNKLIAKIIKLHQDLLIKGEGELGL